MNREQKKNIIDELSIKLREGKNIYFTKISGLDSVQTASLRKLCFDRDVSLLVVKNRLLKKAMENQKEKDFSSFYDLLKENASIMISESSNNPARVIKDFLKKNDTETPIIKGAHIENEIYLGHDQIDVLATLKSKEELIGEVVTLLQSPIKNLLPSLNSSSANISGILKSLSGKKEDVTINKKKSSDNSSSDDTSNEEK
jgi:large subunit ribosomal protein L10